MKISATGPMAFVTLKLNRERTLYEYIGEKCVSNKG